MSGPRRDWTHALRDTPPAPDLTRRIMGRLGYMAVSPEIARRRRWRLWQQRLFLCAGGLAVIALGFVVHQNGTHARRPAANSIPQALERDVDRQRKQFERTFQTICSLVPVIEPVDVDEAEDTVEELEWSAGPVRWL